MKFKEEDIFLVEATPADEPSILDLAQESVEFSRPRFSRFSSQSVQQLARAEMHSLLNMAGERCDFVILVAKVRKTGRFLGYLVLDLAYRDSTTSEKQAFIVDLAVAQDEWNKAVAHMLVEKAVDMALARGLATISGEVSSDNLKTLQAAERLGFYVERYILSCQCNHFPRHLRESEADQA